MSLQIFELVLFTILAAATPLVIAAIGELIVERAGVLNLGVEGMMICGAATGFAVAILTASSEIGVLAGILAGMALAALFGLLTIFMAANQVATGLALTILGLGLSGLIGAQFIGLKRESLGHLYIPLLSDIPLIGKLVFSQDVFVYAGWALVLGTAWFLSRTRAGLTLRAVGENHASAHALGIPVRKIRFLAVLFGGVAGLLPIVAKDILMTGPWGLGLLRSCPAIGAIAMSAVLAYYPITSKAGRKMLIAVVIYGLAIAVFGVIINALPITRRFLTRTLAKAEEANDLTAAAVEIKAVEIKLISGERDPKAALCAGGVIACA
jgi:simple sugar transport system permease protein